MNMSTMQVAKDAIQEAQPNGVEDTNKTDEGDITSLLSSTKRKISQTLSPEASKKKNEVGDANTKLTSPKCKKRITGKRHKKRGKKVAESTPHIHPGNRGAVANAVPIIDTSEEYDTEDEIPLAGLSQPIGNDMDEQPQRIQRCNVPRNRMGKIKRTLHRRQTPLKTKQPTAPQIDIAETPAKPPENPNMDIHSAINCIQSDLQSIKLDGNRLGEAVLDMQREVIRIRSEMITKEVFEANLTQLIRGVNSQVDAQKGEIDHNREKIYETEEKIEAVKANIETQHATQIDHETRLDSIEKTVITDLNSFRKELYGFEERLSKITPPTPFLPSKQNEKQKRAPTIDKKYHYRGPK